MVKKTKISRNLIDILRDEFHDYLHKGGVVTALQGAFDSLHSIPPRKRPGNVLKFVGEHIKSSADGGSSPEDRMMQGELDKLSELERLLLVLRQHLRLVLAAMAPQRYMGLLRGEDIPLGPLPEEEEVHEELGEEEEEEEEDDDDEQEEIPQKPAVDVKKRSRSSMRIKEKDAPKSVVQKKKKSIQGRVRFSAMGKL